MSKENLNELLLEGLGAALSNIIVADDDFNIVYANDNAQQTLASISDVVKQELKVDVREMVGINLDVLHGSRAQEIRKILSTKSNFPYNAEIELGGLILDLKVNRITDSKGNTNGFVLIWDEISEFKKAQEDAARAVSMLDQMPINTLYSTIEGQLTYMNEASRRTLKEIESDLPIKVDKIPGQMIDIFHKNPEMQRKIISDERNLPHKAKIKVGANILDLLVSPIRNNEGDYIGPMVTWAVITDRVKLVDELTQTASELEKSANELVSISSNMSASAEETSSQANTAATGSEEVAAGVQSVATNVEEMTASIKEITKSTNESSSISDSASKLAKNANDIVTKLGESSLDIGNIIKVISSIAQQTNLLALNATIEAARAGEAGKGFAVVANEVKELAKQTATATSDITKKIETIQGDSKSAEGAITEVGEVIENLNSIASSIAASVEEQSAATAEVSRIVQESAEAVKSISTNITQVSEAAEITGKGAIQTNDSSNVLSDIAKKLRGLVDSIEV